MGLTVCKFGGTSVADADQIRAISKIIKSDPGRRFVVVSAPGKRHKEDRKITDLLYLCRELAGQGMDIGEPFQAVEGRFTGMAADLGTTIDVGSLLRELRSQIVAGADTDFVVSRGEYLAARVVADHLGAEFVEAADFVRIREDGLPDEETYSLLSAGVDTSTLHVMPGFYGSGSDGKIRVFPRGGSDISGAIVARAIGASVYENWTDVFGFLMADPTIVENPQPIRELTYREVRELAYMGARVFHEEAIYPLYTAEIPANIRNTNAPDDPGTMIVPKRDLGSGAVIGIAGKTEFTLILIEKLLMDKELGFGRRLFEILERHGVSFEHAPSGIDSMSVIVSDSQLEGKKDTILEEIHTVLKPDRVEIQMGLALVSVVGEGMAHTVGIAARLLVALADADVNVRIIDQGSSEINITVGIESQDFTTALKAAHDAFK